MTSPNPVHRRGRVRPRAVLVLAALLAPWLTPWSGARGHQLRADGWGAGGWEAGVRGQANRVAAVGALDSRGLAKRITAAAVSGLALPLPPSPFAYLHGAWPRPAAHPRERAVFTLDGQAGQQTFTLRQLRALPAVRYATCQPQLQKDAVYEGVPLRDLAALGGFAGRDVRVYASNGYVATIRAQDYLYQPVMLAYRVDGQPIPALQKGPLTVVLPRRPGRFASPAYGEAWVWFVSRLGPVPSGPVPSGPVPSGPVP